MSFLKLWNLPFTNGRAKRKNCHSCLHWGQVDLSRHGKYQHISTWGLIADSSAFVGQQTCFGTNAFSCDSKRTGKWLSTSLKKLVAQRSSTFLKSTILFRLAGYYYGFRSCNNHVTPSHLWKDDPRCFDPNYLQVYYIIILHLFWWCDDMILEWNTKAFWAKPTDRPLMWLVGHYQWKDPCVCYVILNQQLQTLRVHANTLLSAYISPITKVVERCFLCFSFPQLKQLGCSLCPWACLSHWMHRFGFRPASQAALAVCAAESWQIETWLHGEW